MGWPPRQARQVHAHKGARAGREEGAAFMRRLPGFAGPRRRSHCRRARGGGQCQPRHGGALGVEELGVSGGTHRDRRCPLPQGADVRPARRSGLAGAVQGEVALGGGAQRFHEVQFELQAARAFAQGDVLWTDAQLDRVAWLQPAGVDRAVQDMA